MLRLMQVSPTSPGQKEVLMLSFIGYRAMGSGEGLGPREMDHVEEGLGYCAPSPEHVTDSSL